MSLTIVTFQEKEGITLLNEGVIRVNPEKPEYGSIMVKGSPQVKSSTFETGFFSVEERIAFMAGRVDDLKKLNLKPGDNLEDVLKIPLKIVRTESISEKVGMQPVINPTTNETVKTPSGDVIYRIDEIYPEASAKVDIILEKATVAAAVTATNQAARAQMNEQPA